MVTPSVRPLLGLGGLNIILQPGFNDLVGTLLWSLIAMGIAGALFAIAWGVLARRGPPERRREESPQEWKTWLSLAPGSPLRPRLGRVWQPAITWKEFYESTWGWEWFIAMTFLIGPLFALVFTFGFGNAPGTSSLMAASLLATAAVCDAAAEMFGREVRRQTWDTLRLVPISLGRIFWRKAFGRLAAFIPAGFLLIPGLVLVPEDVEWLVRDVAAKPMFYVLAGLYFVAAGSLTLTVLCYRSVTRNPIDAFVCGAGTLAVTLVLAGGMMSDFDLSALPGVLMFGSAVMIVGLTLLIGRQIRRILEGEV
jgi:hypothetical protein